LHQAFDKGVGAATAVAATVGGVVVVVVVLAFYKEQPQVFQLL
jgi:hypothetical protein